MRNYEEQYLSLLSDVYHLGVHSKNRTGVNTYKIWGAQLYIDLTEGFPLLTTKKMHWKSVVHELMWMIKGDTNIQYLLKNGVTFWTEWPFQKYLNSHNQNETQQLICDQKAFEQRIINDDEFAKKWGSIGKYGYGGLWRNFPVSTNPIGFLRQDYMEVKGWEVQVQDQLTKAIDELKNNPDSRRIIISVWHPFYSNSKEHALLPACHNYIQFGTEELTHQERIKFIANKYNKDHSYFDDFTDEQLNERNIPKYRLNCYFNMRSNDVPLGLPYNVAFYALFTHLVAHCVNMIPSQLVYSGADVHIYENQIDGIKEQLTRTPSNLPKLIIKSDCPTNIFDVKFDSIEIVDYNPQSHIKMPVAV